MPKSILLSEVKPEPKIFTWAPTGPEEGVRDVIDGAAVCAKAVAANSHVQRIISIEVGRRTALGKLTSMAIFTPNDTG